MVETYSSGALPPQWGPKIAAEDHCWVTRRNPCNQLQMIGKASRGETPALRLDSVAGAPELDTELCRETLNSLGAVLVRHGCCPRQALWGQGQVLPPPSVTGTEAAVADIRASHASNILSFPWLA